MEQRLTEFPALHIDGIDGDLAPIKIGLITFAFDNSEVILGLKKRGNYIKKENWDKLSKINCKFVEEIRKVKRGESLLDKLQKPVACFMTMETEEGKCRADEYNETVQMGQYLRYKNFLGEEIDMRPASEPTDIIWENRHVTIFEKF